MTAFNVVEEKVEARGHVMSLPHYVRWCCLAISWRYPGIHRGQPKAVFVVAAVSVSNKSVG
jgi:hypothetical protein